MSDLICRNTMRRCQTPGMCSPHGGCGPSALADADVRTSASTAPVSPFAGVTLIRNPILPDNTMVVSADLYDLLAKDGKGAQETHQNLMSRVEALNELIRRQTKQ